MAHCVAAFGIRPLVTNGRVAREWLAGGIEYGVTRRFRTHSVVCGIPRVTSSTIQKSPRTVVKKDYKKPPNRHLARSYLKTPSRLLELAKTSGSTPHIVIPAQAGIQHARGPLLLSPLDSRLRGNDDVGGMHGYFHRASVFAGTALEQTLNRYTGWSIFLHIGSMVKRALLPNSKIGHDGEHHGSAENGT